MKKLKFITPIILSAAGGCSIPLSSCCHKILQEVNFANDSWENIISYANNGIKALIDHYKPNGGTFVITPADVTKEQIAAKTRVVHIDNYGDFKVRVAGECIDKIDDNTNATLTFEFAEVIEKDCFHNDLTAANPSAYATSHIKAKLSQILNNFPVVLKNNLKTVKQTTAVITETGNYDSIVSDEKLFIMTLDEVWGVCAETEPAVIYENYCYQNYQYSTHQSTNYHIKQYFNKETNKYEDCSYWLRTPIILEEGTNNKECYVIDRGGFFSNYQVDSYAGISPCFCLGKENKGVINIGCSTPGFDVCSPQIVNVDQNIVLKIKPKKYHNQNVCKMPDETDEGKAEFRIFCEDGRVYSDSFKYDASTGEVTFVQNRINKSLVFEMWNSQIALDYKNFVELCHEDEQNNKNGLLILNYFNVGNWLHIKLDNIDYKVNIIGIGHDTASDGKKAAVTLEFYDTLDGYKWDDSGNCDYVTSSLNKNLNGNNSTSIINKLLNACPDLATSIKDVHKNVFVKKNNKWIVQDITTKLFILSDDEFLGDSKRNEISLGSFYEYYKVNKEDIELVSRSGCDIWTRSPYIKDDEKQILVFRKEQGKILTDSFSSDAEYVHVAPAFCI